MFTHTHESPGPLPVSHLRGVTLVVAAFCILPALDAIAKHLTDSYHVTQIVWARLLFQALVVVAFVALRRQLRFTTGNRPGLLIFTVAMIWLANFPIIIALAYMPLADAFALVMTTPLIVTALSAWLLAETVSVKRWVTVVAGFVGALVIIRPGLGVFHWSALLPMLSALFFAFYQIGARSLSKTMTSIDILLWASVVPLLASCLLVGAEWQPVHSPDWILMAVMGVGAGIGHFLLIAALKHAPASVLAPFMYLQLISSTLIGLTVFGDFPDTFTLLGAAIIVFSGLYAMRLKT